ncbi:MAG: amino acid permease [Acidobacteria bacterium]|nr:amino acid permease [Acidobacteriota bacterium]MCI0627828.1 amino acid permease [Acidobacteriota bacterium]MCI0721241.1 amino acid permease [Acidobacteriota bacterium]
MKISAPPQTSATQASDELKRDLGLMDCALLVIGSVIGSGIFLTPGNIARTVQSVESVFLVWVAGGLLSFFGALAYAELGAMFPRAGGIYVFLREAYGPLTAFLYGWCTFFVMQSGSVATLAAGFAIYLGYLLPVSSGVAKICAVGVIAFLTLINCLGVRSGARVQNILTIVKMASLVGISVVLFTMSGGSFGHFSYVPPATAGFSWSALGIAMIAVLWAYEGWHTLTYNAGEVSNPKRNLTGGLLLGTLAIIVLYLTVNLAYLYALPFEKISGSRRLASDAMELALGPVGGTLIAVAILISITGAINSNTMGGPRVYFAMARENLFFKRFAYVQPRYVVPTFSIVLQGVWASSLTLMGSFDRLFSYVIFVCWIFYGLGGVAVLVLRWKRPELERHYKTWGYPFVPLLFALMAFLIVGNTLVNDFKNSFWGLVVVFTGLPAYYYWQGRKKLTAETPRR